MNILDKSTDKTMDLSLASTEIESFEASISLLDSFEYSASFFLKAKMFALDEIILEGEEDLFNSDDINKAPKLCFKQQSIIYAIPTLSLE